MGSLSTAMSPLGLMIAGPTADHLGVRAWFIIGGIVTFSMGFIGLLVPGIMNIEKESKTHSKMDESINDKLTAKI